MWACAIQEAEIISERLEKVVFLNDNIEKVLDPDTIHWKNLVSCSQRIGLHFPEISRRFIDNFLSNPVNGYTDKPTIRDKYITSYAELMRQTTAKG